MKRARLHVPTSPFYAQTPRELREIQHGNAKGPSPQVTIPTTKPELVRGASLVLAAGNHLD
jgi:hypothetical protein